MNDRANERVEDETSGHPPESAPAVEEKVRLKYCHGYDDGPISGVAVWKGKRYYFHMTEEAERHEGEEDPSWYRRYALYELTDQEWDEEDDARRRLRLT